MKAVVLCYKLQRRPVKRAYKLKNSLRKHVAIMRARPKACQRPCLKAELLSKAGASKKTHKKAQKISYSITAAQNVSDVETARDERGQSFGVGVNSSTPKLIGTSFHANAERRSNASDISTTEQTAKVDTSSGFSKEQSEVYQAIKENRMNYSDDETRRLAQDFRHSYDHAANVLLLFYLLKTFCWPYIAVQNH